MFTGKTQINGGRLSVDGELVGYKQRGDKLYELHDKEIAQKRAEIGMVFQRFNLFPHMTVLENLTLAPRRVHGLNEADEMSLYRPNALMDSPYGPADLETGDATNVKRDRRLNSTICNGECRAPCRTG